MNAQTDQQIEEQMNKWHWIYRQRFQKSFVRIGPEAGQSISAASYDSSFGIPVIKASMITFNIPDLHCQSVNEGIDLNRKLVVVR